MTYKMKMKKITYKSAVCLLLLIFSSCEDYLDKSPDMGLTQEQVFSDYVTAEGVVDRAMGLLHNYMYDDYDYGGEMGTFSDECQIAKNGGISNTVNTGNWLDYSGAGMSWSMRLGEYTNSETNAEFAYRHHFREIQGEAVAGIRTVNLALENMDNIASYPAGSQYSPEQLKSQLKGQCYFLRGWFYFMIIRDYGGMPKMQRSFSSDEDFDIQRPTYLESNEWLVQDLDSAIRYLPNDWLSSPNEIGRPTKASAKALKAMVLLYAASPNSNISREESLGFTGDPMTKFNSTIAAEGLNASIDAIQTAETHPRYKMYSETDYMRNFRQTNAEGQGLSNEALFQCYIRRVGSGVITGAGMYLPSWDASQSWANYSEPTHNAVDFYETSDGWEVGDRWDLGQGDAVEKSTIWSPNDPYNHRDPRLKKFIFCQGDNMYISDKVADTPENNGQRSGLPPVLHAEIPNGAHYDYETTRGWNFTGFYHAGKYRWPGNNKANGTNGYTRVCVYIRMAQLYLDFAEMANELNGPTVAVEGLNAPVSGVHSALDAINYVRDRVGMPAVRSKYYSSKEAFREYIRKERARELFYEQHRWWDLKRWRTAHTELSKGIWVANISKSGSTYTYGKKKSAYAREFTNKQYWYPFPSRDMNLFKNFEQNPGW